MGNYMGREYHRTPGENTIGYRPLDSENTLNDLSGNNLTLLNNGTNKVTFVDNYGLWASGKCFLYRYSVDKPENFTVACWVYKPAQTSIIWKWKIGTSSSTNFTLAAGYLPNAGGYGITFCGIEHSINVQSTNRYRIVCTFEKGSGNTGTATLYIDGQKIGTNTYGTRTANTDNIWFGIDSDSTNNPLGENARMSNIIIESAVWDDDGVLLDFNSTKEDYGY